MGSIKVDWTDEMYIGAGFDYLKSEVKGFAAKPLPKDPLSSESSESQSYEARVTQIENTNDMNSSMEVGADLSVGYGVYSGDASFKYTKDKNIHKYGLYYLVTASVKNSSTTLIPGVYELSDKAKNNAKNGKFGKKFGDYFISGFVGGGSFTGLIEVHTENDSEKIKIEQELKAKGGFGKAQVGLSEKFANEVNNLNQNHKVTISLCQVGGDSAVIPLTTMDEIMKRAQELPAQISKNPSRIKAIITPYDTLADFDLEPEYKVNFVNDQKEALSKAYLTGKYYRDSVLYAQENPEQFNMSHKELDKLLDALNKYLDNVMEAREELDSEPKKSAKIPSLPDDVWKIPPRVGDPQATFNPPSVRFDRIYEKIDLHFDSKFGNDASEFIHDFANDVGKIWSYIKAIANYVLDNLDAMASSTKQALEIFKGLDSRVDTVSSKASNKIKDLSEKLADLKDEYKDNTDFTKLSKAVLPILDDNDGDNTAVGGNSFFKQVKDDVDKIKAILREAPDNQNFNDIVLVNKALWKDLLKSSDEAQDRIGSI